MNLITLHDPEIRANEVIFRWRINPPTQLYRNSQFSLRFPESLDLTRVPEGLWSTIALICLHSQWPLLRPCRVKLPFRLSAGEKEAWLRLMDSYVTTMEAYRDTRRLEREIVIQDDGEPIQYSPMPESSRCATAFSGGKDSLLQVGLLTELTTNPLLVTTTSTLPPLEDHLTARRRQILHDVTQRRNVTLIEVESDFRSNWDVGAADYCPFGVNEVSDTFLYLGAMIAAAAALGVPHVFLASEVEANENVTLNGRVVQHPHFMYSVATLAALQELLQPWGIRCGSLTSPLHSFHVQELLWKRYRDLRDLQYSCWRVKQDESVCNACSQCLRIALSAIALGDDPGLMGADLVKVLNAMRGWFPYATNGDYPVLPKQISRNHLNAHIMRAVSATPENVIAEHVANLNDAESSGPSRQNAIAAYRELRQRALDYNAVPDPGYRAGYERFIDPLLREKISQIYAEHFMAADESSYAGALARSQTLANWITDPLKTVPETEVANSGLSAEDVFRYRHLIPAPEPVVVKDTRFIPVADTRLDGNESVYLNQCIESNWISSSGPFVRKFEEQFAHAVGCKFGVACASGTIALHLTLATLGIKAGDEVIIPAFTMIAVPNAVTYTGAHPVLVDVEPDTWNIDVAKLEAKITPRTRAIIAVHTYGHPAEMDAIVQIARRHNLHVIEDAAEAHGAEYKERQVGSLGTAATFSFYANKIITTGEGGMITTNDRELADLCRTLRDHGFSEDRHFWHRHRGFSYRMTNLQGAMGLAQTERMAELVELRRANARLYSRLLSSIPGLTLPQECQSGRSVFWMYGVLVNEEFGCTRDELRAWLASEGIETRTFFIPIHVQPIYRQRYLTESYPVSEMLSQKGLYLPSGPTLTEEDIHFVAEAIASRARH